jgi:hypothetical protein
LGGCELGSESGFAETAPPVFWFKSSASKEYGLQDLARLAASQLQTSDEEIFRFKLQRWLGRASSAQAIVVLDGINERHGFQFWTDYILHLVGELGPNVLLVITCRPDTWRKQLLQRLYLPAMEFDLNEFDEQEFGAAMRDQPREIVEKLWALGSVARKPRYLADVLGNCELLVQGGNREWLTQQARRDLESDAPYFKRRGMLLLAGSGCEKSDLDAAVLALGDGPTGLEDVVQTAMDYIERLAWMQHWASAMMLAESATNAKCAAMLLLHCSDARVWTLLVDAMKENRQPRCGATLLQLLPRDDVRKAVKATLKERDKSLFGYRKAEGYAVPWLQSETQSSIHLPI